MKVNRLAIFMYFLVSVTTVHSHKIFVPNSSSDAQKLQETHQELDQAKHLYHEAQKKTRQALDNLHKKEMELYKADKNVKDKKMKREALWAQYYKPVVNEAETLKKAILKEQLDRAIQLNRIALDTLAYSQKSLKKAQREYAIAKEKESQTLQKIKNIDQNYIDLQKEIQPGIPSIAHTLITAPASSAPQVDPNIQALLAELYTTDVMQDLENENSIMEELSRLSNEAENNNVNPVLN